MKLQGQNVWLIGASSGIGAALAPRLTGAGAKLAISSRREEELQKVASTCVPAGVLVKPLDVTDLDAVEAVYRDLVAEWGAVDSVIYNAGTWTLADVTKFEARTALRQIDVNYLGLIRVVGTVMPAMIQRRAGAIVGVASVAGYAGFPRAAAYSSSKAGVHAFLSSIRMELSKYGVDVVTVSPGFVDTPLTEDNDFRMPFMVSADVAADRILEGLLEGRQEIHFPRRLSIPLKLATALPRPAFEFLGRKFMSK